MHTINPAALVNMNAHESNAALRVELVYAQEDNSLLGQAVYRPQAQLWLHKDLANIVLEAARLYHTQTGGRLVLYDGLRTVEAQEAMLKTQRVQDHPHWLEEPRLLSPPGSGAHPRGMAIDLSLEDKNGALLDMGTPFDFLADDPGPQANPAHRNYVDLNDVVHRNRALLDDCLFSAAQSCDVPLIGLPQEWWDYRLPRDIYSHYAPLRDADLPEAMRLCLRQYPDANSENPESTPQGQHSAAHSEFPKL